MTISGGHQVSHIITQKFRQKGVRNTLYEPSAHVEISLYTGEVLVVMVSYGIYTLYHGNSLVVGNETLEIISNTIYRLFGSIMIG